MTRADVHYALAIDTEIWEASRVDPDLLDPVVRVDSVPGTAHPFTVVRDYQGPQGYYLERFTITSPTGQELYASVERKVHLRGEMFEDRVMTQVPHLPIDRGDEHTLTFFVDGDLVNSVPMFLEVGGGGDSAIMAEETLSKALGKGAVVWLVIPRQKKRRWKRKDINRPRGLVYDDHQQPAWYVFDGGAVYVFSGPTEQEIDGLSPDTTELEIIARSKDHRSAVVRTKADVSVVPTDDATWERIADQAMGRRLNLPDGEGAADRWRENCTLYRLTPRFAGGADVAGSTDGAAAGAGGGGGAAAEKKEIKRRPEDLVHVEAQVDQEVYDKLIAEGKSERVARAKAKAAYVRAEKKRIVAEKRAAGEIE